MVGDDPDVGCIAPTLNGRVNGGPSFEVGDTVTVDYAATGVGSPITELRLGYLDACGTNEGFSGGTSPVDYTVPANTWRPGTHTLRSLSVFDAFGNYTSYLRDGSVTYYPKSGAAIHDTHTLDLFGGDLVVGGDPDLGCIAPTLDSFSVNGGPSFEVGDTVSVDYAATGVGFPITELRLGYLDACGTNEGFSGGTSPVDYTVPANTWRPGTHTLRSLSVFDAFGNYTSYLRDGSVTYYPKSGAPIHDTHTLDLSGGDLVVGDDLDVGCIAPTLDSFSVNGGPSFEVGDTVSVDYAATGVGFPITELRLGYLDACGTNEGFSGGTSPVDYTVPANTWRPRTHTLRSLSVFDAFGNYTSYLRDGSVTYYPKSGAAIHDTHTLDLSGGDLVVGDDPDVGCIAPTLDSFSVNGGPSFEVGDTVSVDYAATGVGFPITELRLGYLDACGTNEGFSGGTSPVDYTVPANTWRPGTHTLRSLSVFDAFGNYTSYLRDGSVTYYPKSGAAIHDTHTLDLSGGDLVVGDDPDVGCIAPTLDSFSVNGGPSFEVGDTVSVDYAATGVGFPITELRLGYLDACGTNEGFSGGTSPVDYTVPANTWRPGTHTLRSLSVFDAFGNYTSYLRDGSVTYYPKSGAAIHDTHTLDLSGGDLVVGDDPHAGRCTTR